MPKPYRLVTFGALADGMEFYQTKLKRSGFRHVLAPDLTKVFLKLPTFNFENRLVNAELTSPISSKPYFYFPTDEEVLPL